MNWEMTACIFGFFILSSVKIVSCTLFTRCNNSTSVVYEPEPLYTGTCKSLIEATTQCLMSPLCDLISINGTQCSFHTVKDRVVCDPVGISNGTVTKAEFRSCNYIFSPDPWTRLGALYLHVTPDTYTCDQGQAVCSSLGGTMAEFHNATEMDIAYTFITDSVFVGIDYVSGQYVWQTTGLEVSTDFWAPNQPRGEPCVQLWIRNYGLDDTFSYKYKHVLCEKRIP